MRADAPSASKISLEFATEQRLLPSIGAEVGEVARGAMIDDSRRRLSRAALSLR
jgi:hypothetical protein